MKKSKKTVSVGAIVLMAGWGAINVTFEKVDSGVLLHYIYGTGLKGLPVSGLHFTF